VGGRLRACGTVDELADELDDRWVFDIGLVDVERPRELLEQLPGVSGCTRSEGRWLVHADTDVRAELHRAVVAAGGRLSHLARREADLDAIYHRYFEGGDREHEHVRS
jgi:ABC-2 type transport system ATP-binding protein